MAKAKSPYLSEIRGSVAKKFTFRKLKPYNTQLIQSIPIPSYTRTAKQDAQRTKFAICKTIWNAMDSEEKEKHRVLAEQLNLTPYQAFMSKCLSELILYNVYIDNTQNPNNLIDFQVLLEINNDQRFFEDCNYNKNAVSFYDENLKNPIPYFIEEWNPDTSSAKIWLKVPLIRALETTTIKLLIVPSKQTTESDPSKVFDFYDDFEGSSLDTSKWGDSNLVSISDSIATLDPNGSNGAWLYTAKTFDVTKVIAEAKAKLSNEYGSWKEQGMGFSDGTGENLRADNEIIYLKYYDDGSERLMTRKDGSGTEVKTNIITAGAWHVYGVTGYGGTAKVFVDYVEKARATSNVPVENLKLCVVAQHNLAGVLQVDWVRVRKYTDPEPILTYEKIT